MSLTVSKTGRGAVQAAFAFWRQVVAALCILALALPAHAQDQLKPWLGLSFQPVTESVASALGIESAGVLVSAVIQGSPAQKAGLMPGDLILSLDGQPVTTMDSFTDIMGQSLPGLTIPITLVRDGATLGLEATLVATPAKFEPADFSFYEKGDPPADTSGRQTIGGAIIATLNPAIAEPLGLGRNARGAVVLSVEQGSPAEELGLERGDAIFSVNLKRTTSALAVAEAYLARPGGPDSAALLMVGDGDTRTFGLLAAKAEGYRAKWGAMWDLAGKKFATSAGDTISSYGWLEYGKRLALSNYTPGLTNYTNYAYVLQDDGTIGFGDLKKVGENWEVPKITTRGRPIDGRAYDWVINGDTHLLTYDIGPSGWSYSRAEKRRNGTLKEVNSSGTFKLVDEAAIEQLAAAYKRKQAQLAQQQAQQQAQAQAQRSSGGGGGLLGALGGAMLGSIAGGNTEQIVGAAMKGAAMVDPNMSALDSVGNEMIGGNTGSVGGLGSLGGSAGGSYPTRPNALGGSAACSMMNQGNYRDVSLSGGNDVQLKTMCGQAFEYYSMYLRAIEQGYSEADANRTYDAHQQAALNAISFYENNR